MWDKNGGFFFSSLLCRQQTAWKWCPILQGVRSWASPDRISHRSTVLCPYGQRRSKEGRWINPVSNRGLDLHLGLELGLKHYKETRLAESFGMNWPFWKEEKTWGFISSSVVFYSVMLWYWYSFHLKKSRLRLVSHYHYPLSLLPVWSHYKIFGLGPWLSKLRITRQFLFTKPFVH